MNCESVLKTAFGETIKLNAVVDGSEENKSFSKYTPSASLSMQVDNPDAVGVFTPGRNYYVDFTPAE
jgi:hypothetical protein